MYFQNLFLHLLLYLISPYSFRIAANGLSFIARIAGKNPATMPMMMANPTDGTASQIGITDSFPSIPYKKSLPETG